MAVATVRAPTLLEREQRMNVIEAVASMRTPSPVKLEILGFRERVPAPPTLRMKVSCEANRLNGRPSPRLLLGAVILRTTGEGDF